MAATTPAAAPKTPPTKAATVPPPLGPIYRLLITQESSTPAPAGFERVERTNQSTEWVLAGRYALWMSRSPNTDDPAREIVELRVGGDCPGKDFEAVPILNNSDEKSSGGSAQQPSGSAQQPSGSAQQPSGSAQQPSGSAQQPSGSAQQPSGSAQQPSGSAQQPSGSAQQQKKRIAPIWCRRATEHKSAGQPARLDKPGSAVVDLRLLTSDDPSAGTGFVQIANELNPGVLGAKHFLAFKVATAQAKIDKAEFRVGDLMDAYWPTTKSWYVVRIIKLVDANTVRVHYEGWGDEFDHDIGKKDPHLAPHRSKTGASVNTGNQSSRIPTDLDLQVNDIGRLANELDRLHKKLADQTTNEWQTNAKAESKMENIPAMVPRLGLEMILTEAEMSFLFKSGPDSAFAWIPTIMNGAMKDPASTACCQRFLQTYLRIVIHAMAWNRAFPAACMQVLTLIMGLDAHCTNYYAAHGREPEAKCNGDISYAAPTTTTDLIESGIRRFSTLFVENVSVFASSFGLEAFCMRLMHSHVYCDPLPVIMRLFWLMQAIHSTLSPVLVQQVLLSRVDLKSMALQQIANASEDDVKQMELDQLRKLSLHVQILTGKVDPRYCDSMVLAGILRMLKSDNLEKKLAACTHLEAAFRPRVERVSLTPDEIAAWVEINDIVRLMTSHESLINRVAPVLSFLADRKVLHAKHFEMLWDAGMKQGDTVMRLVFSAIKEIIPLMNAANREAVVQLFQSIPAHQMTECHIIGLREFVDIAVRDDHARPLSQPRSTQNLEFYGIKRLWHLQLATVDAKGAEGKSKTGERVSENVQRKARFELVRLITLPLFKELENGYVREAVDLLRNQATPAHTATAVIQFIRELIDDKATPAPTTHPAKRTLVREENTASVADHLNTTHHLLAAVIDELVRTFEPVQQQPKAATFASEEEGDSALKVRLDFIALLLRAPSASVEPAVVDKLWYTFVERPERAGDRRRLLDWLSVALTGPHVVEGRRLLASSVHLFDKILCDPARVSPHTIDMDMWNVFYRFFWHVNATSSKALYLPESRDPEQGATLRIDDVRGLAVIWHTFANPDSKIVQQAIKLLITIHVRVTPLLSVTERSVLIRRLIETLVHEVDHLLAVSSTSAATATTSAKVTDAKDVVASEKQSGGGGGGMLWALVAALLSTGRPKSSTSVPDAKSLPVVPVTHDFAAPDVCIRTSVALASALFSLVRAMERESWIQGHRFRVDERGPAYWKNSMRTTTYRVWLKALQPNGTYDGFYDDGDIDHNLPDGHLAWDPTPPGPENPKPLRDLPHRVLAGGIILQSVRKWSQCSNPVISEIALNLLERLTVPDSDSIALANLPTQARDTNAAGRLQLWSEFLPSAKNYAARGQLVQTLRTLRNSTLRHLPLVKKNNAETKQHQQQQQQQQQPSVNWLVAAAETGGFQWAVCGLLAPDSRDRILSSPTTLVALVALSHWIRATLQHVARSAAPTDDCGRAVAELLKSGTLMRRLVDLVAAAVSVHAVPATDSDDARFTESAKVWVATMDAGSDGHLKKSTHTALTDVITNCLASINLCRNLTTSVNDLFEGGNWNAIMRNGLTHPLDEVREALRDWIAEACTTPEAFRFFVPKLIVAFDSFPTLSKPTDNNDGSVESAVTLRRVIGETKSTTAVWLSENTGLLCRLLGQSMDQLLKPTDAFAEADRTSDEPLKDEKYSTHDVKDVKDVKDAKDGKQQIDSAKVVVASLNADVRRAAALELCSVVLNKIHAHVCTETTGLGADIDPVLVGLTVVARALVRLRPDVKPTLSSHILPLLHSLFAEQQASSSSSSGSSGSSNPCMLLTIPRRRSNLARGSCLGLLEELSTGTGGTANAKIVADFVRRMHLAPTISDWKFAMSEAKARPATGYVGLKNLGCTCYINAALQALYMTPELRQSVLSIDFSREEDMTTAAQAVSPLVQLQMLYLNMQESQSDALLPRSFVGTLKNEEGKQLNPAVQEDAAGFLLRLLDRLRTEVRGTRWSEIFAQLFDVCFVTQKIGRGKCTHVTERSVRGAEGVGLTVSIRDKANLKDALAAYVSGEEMDGVQCEACSSRVPVTRRTVIDQLPPILVINLKRFEIDENLLPRKLHSKFEFPHGQEALDMRPYCATELPIPRGHSIIETNATKSSSKMDDATVYEYDLAGVVCHTGELHGGHYYAYIREVLADGSYGRWFEFNDHRVEPFNPDDIPAECFGGSETIAGGGKLQRSRSAYILFYRRRSLHPHRKDTESKSAVTSGVRVNVPEHLLTMVEQDTLRLWRIRCLMASNYTDMMWAIANAAAPTLASALITAGDAQNPKPGSLQHASLSGTVVCLDTSSREILKTFAYCVFNTFVRMNLVISKGSWIVWVHRLRRFAAADVEFSSWLIETFIAPLPSALISATTTMTAAKSAAITKQQLTSLSGKRSWASELLLSAQHFHISNQTAGLLSECIHALLRAPPSATRRELLERFTDAMGEMWYEIGAYPAKDSEFYFRVLQTLIDAAPASAERLMRRHDLLHRTLSLLAQRPLMEQKGASITVKDDAEATKILLPLLDSLFTHANHLSEGDCALLRTGIPRLVHTARKREDNVEGRVLARIVLRALQLVPDILPVIVHATCAALNDGDHDVARGPIRILFRLCRALCKKPAAAATVSVPKATVPPPTGEKDPVDWRSNPLAFVLDCFTDVIEKNASYWRLTDYLLEYLLRMADRLSPVRHWLCGGQNGDATTKHPGTKFVERALEWLNKHQQPPYPRTTSIYGPNLYDRPGDIQLLKAAIPDAFRATGWDELRVTTGRKIADKILCFRQFTTVGQPDDAKESSQEGEEEEDEADESQEDLAARVFKVGDLVDFYVRTEWYVARVVRVMSEIKQLEVHILEYAELWNETVSFNDRRIAKFGQRVPEDKKAAALKFA